MIVPATALAVIVAVSVIVEVDQVVDHQVVDGSHVENVMLVVTGNINVLNIYEYLSTRYPSTTILVLITSTTITFALIWFRC